MVFSFILDYDYMCSETDFTQEKVNFRATSGSPIPPLTAAALQMFICMGPAPHFDNHEEGMKNVKQSNFNEKKDQNFHICL